MEVIQIHSSPKTSLRTIVIGVALLAASFYAGTMYGSYGTVDGARAAEIERDLQRAQQLYGDTLVRFNEVRALADTSLKTVRSLEERNRILEELVNEVASTNDGSRVRLEGSQRLIGEGQRILQTARERSAKADKKP